MAGRRLDRAGLALDGDAWIVADFLARPGERIEEGRFPGVRIAEDGNPRGGCRGHGPRRFRGWTSYDFFRRAHVGKIAMQAASDLRRLSA